MGLPLSSSPGTSRLPTHARPSGICGPAVAPSESMLSDTRARTGALCSPIASSLLTPPLLLLRTLHLVLFCFVAFFMFNNAVTVFLCRFLTAGCLTEPLSKLTDGQVSEAGIDGGGGEKTNQSRHKRADGAVPDHLQQLLHGQDTGNS